MEKEEWEEEYGRKWWEQVGSNEGLNAMANGREARGAEEGRSG